MSDAAAGYGVRAYSLLDGDEIRELCEDCAAWRNTEEPEVYVIEEYEEEDTFKYVKDYYCDECGKEQYEIEEIA